MSKKLINKLVISLFIIFSPVTAQSEIGDIFLCEVPHNFELGNPELFSHYKDNPVRIMKSKSNMKVKFVCNPNEYNMIRVNIVFGDGSQDEYIYSLDRDSYCDNVYSSIILENSQDRIAVDRYVGNLDIDGEEYDYSFTSTSKVGYSESYVSVYFGGCNRL